MLLQSKTRSRLEREREREREREGKHEREGKKKTGTAPDRSAKLQSYIHSSCGSPMTRK